ncbi:MAG: hypothetical protein EG825_06440 [Rhodocyclaceae bacterium]|nr:hypothetical protein [Rhodocyclaceae bacterium]
MKIAASELVFQSQHAATTQHELKESLRSWVGNRRPDFEGRAGGGAPDGLLPSIHARISEAAREALAAQSAATSSLPAATADNDVSAIEAVRNVADNDPMLSLIRHMVEMLTGQPIKLFSAQGLSGNGTSGDAASAPSAPSAPSRQPTQRPAGFGVEYERHEVYQETESTTFSAQGVVRTADGKDIQFQLHLSMTREFHSQSDVSLRLGDAQRKDPLVINFGGNAAQLSDRTFQFDLDADGRKENIAQLEAGSGYLALDLNGNRRIDSGKELFGPASGFGFNELASHDQDGNGWIDENDAVFKLLEVWTPTSDGNGKLVSLADLGIGALSLAALTTPFALRGANNSDLGAIRESGIYLREDGSAGTLQEIDLTI